MNNTLKYFYDIRINNIRQNGNVFFIEDGIHNYAFQKCNDFVDIIELIYQLNLYLISNNIYIYEIIKNKFDSLTTVIENDSFVLLKIDKNYDKKITLETVLNFQYKIQNNIKLNANNWRNLWMEKIDYYEYQMSMFGIKYPIIKESMNYYIGMTENAISALHDVKNDDLYLQHRRITCFSTYYDFYNPLNLIFDTRIRDLCEFYKSNFIYNDNNIRIGNIIKMLNYSSNEYLLFYIRMLFPSYYFDTYEKIVFLKDDEKKIKKIINKINDYQILLFELSMYLSDVAVIPNIEWIK